MELLVTILLPLSMAALLVVLALGLYQLFKGDEKARASSNKLMRLRVILQGVAVLLLIAVVYFRDRGA